MYDRFRIASSEDPEFTEVYPTLTDALRAAMADKRFDVWLHDDKCNSDIAKRSDDCPCKPVQVQKATRS